MPAIAMMIVSERYSKNGRVAIRRLILLLGGGPKFLKLPLLN